MTKALAIFQIIIVASMVIYSTVQLFLGNFEQAVSPFPLLILYYVFVISHHKRKSRLEDVDE